MFKAWRGVMIYPIFINLIAIKVQLGAVHDDIR